MKGEKTLTLIGGLFAILLLTLFSALLCCPPEHRPLPVRDLLSDYKVHYGLDLKGGSELRYAIKDLESTSSHILDEVVGVISQRIFESNIVKDPKVQKEGENQVLIQLPGLNQVETDKIKKEIETLGNLEFRLVASKNVGSELTEEAERPKYERAISRGEKKLKEYEQELLEKGYRWYGPRSVEGEHNTHARLLWVKDGYDFTGTKFKSFYITMAETSQCVGFELKEEYKAYFGNFTEKYKKELLAIVFNNKVFSAPSINSRIDGQGVMLGFGIEQMNQLLKVLRSGSLEMQPELIQENSIGPSLGEDAIRLGISAGLLGVASVIAFMLVYYLGLGLVAIIGMFVNVILIGAILVISGETLTLPGIAGILVSMGMSVDANILIFERIREEKAKRLEMFKEEHKTDKTHFKKEELLDIQSNGYDRAFTTIFDSNITTLLSAVILYFLGSGPVQGFGFTLAWGMITNLFTAVLFCRLLSTLFIEMGLLRSMSMLEWIRSDRNYKFTQVMRYSIIASTICIVLGLILFISRGEKNYGLDLRGGILAQISLEQPVTTQAVREKLKGKFQVEIQHIESTQGSQEKGWYDFLIQMPNLNLDKIEGIDKQIDEVAAQIKKKNAAIKEFSSIVIRETENEKRAQKEINKLRREKASADDIKVEEARREECRRLMQENKAKETELSKELSALTQKRQDLTREKNLLGGIEELRKEIEKQFEKEISPLPFGTLTKGEGKFASYHVLPIFMKTAVPAEFIKKTVQSDTDLLKEVKLGSTELAASFQLKNAMTESELTEELKKHLDQLHRLEAKDLKVTKGAAANAYDVHFVFTTPVPEDAIAKVLEKLDATETKVDVLYQGQKNLKAFQLFVLLTTERSTGTLEDKQKLVEEKIRTVFENVTFAGERVYLSNPFPRFTQISGLVAKAQKAKAFQAVLLALIMMIAYIAFRFPKGLMYGVAASATLTHDVLFTLGAIALASTMGWVDVQVDMNTIAALLTLVGFSINNTIVIFDRIREHQKKFEKEVWERLDQKKISSIFDLALNQTLARTTYTSLTVLFVLICIFIINYGKGSVMEGFSFTLGFGSIVGTYSSWFIATALALMYEKKDRPR